MDTNSSDVAEIEASNAAEGRLEKTQSGSDEEKKKSGLADFAQKVLLLLIGFILTGILGVILSEGIKRSFLIEDFQAKNYESDLSQMQKSFDALSGLMDRRLFRMRRLVDSFQDEKLQEQRSQRLLDYRAVLIEWNDGLNKNKANFVFNFCRTSLESGLSSDDCTSRYDDVSKKFNNAHKLVDAFIRDNRATEMVEITNALNSLNVDIYLLDDFMLQSALSLRSKFEEAARGRSPLPYWLNWPRATH
jgi:hypothetical protein